MSTILNTNFERPRRSTRVAKARLRTRGDAMGMVEHNVSHWRRSHQSDAKGRDAFQAPPRPNQEKKYGSSKLSRISTKPDTFVAHRFETRLVESKTHIRDVSRKRIIACCDNRFESTKNVLVSSAMSSQKGRVQVSYAERFMNEVALLPARRNRRMSTRRRSESTAIPERTETSRPVGPRGESKHKNDTSPTRKRSRTKPFSPRDSLARLSSLDRKRHHSSSGKRKRIDCGKDESKNGIKPLKRKLRKRVHDSYMIESSTEPLDETYSVDDEDELAKALRRATVPHRRSSSFKIWKRLSMEHDSGASLEEGGYNDLVFPMLKEESMMPSSASHDFCLVHRVVTSKVVAGLYHSAIKYAHDVLLSWYVEAEKRVRILLHQRSDLDALSTVDSLRTSLAGMWCVYAQLLLSISSHCSQGGKPADSAPVRRRTCTKRNQEPVGKRLLRSAALTEEDDFAEELEKRHKFGASASAADLSKYALSVIVNAACCCPIVGNHPWIFMAHSRLLLLGAEKLREDLEVGSLRCYLQSAIKIQRGGIYKSNPQLYLRENETSSCVCLDGNQVVGFLSGQRVRTRSADNDDASLNELKWSFGEIQSLIPKVRSVFSKNYLFRDKRGGRMLCGEVNRLSRLQEKLDKSESMQLNKGSLPGLALGDSEQTCIPGLDCIESKVVAFQPLESETDNLSFVLEKTVSAEKVSKSNHTTESGPCGSKVLDMQAGLTPGHDAESSIESPPTLVALDCVEQFKVESDAQSHEVNVVPNQPNEEPMPVDDQPLAGNSTRNESIPVREKWRPGSACSCVETGSPLEVQVNKNSVVPNLPLGETSVGCLGDQCVKENADPAIGIYPLNFAPGCACFCVERVPPLDIHMLAPDGFGGSKFLEKNTTVEHVPDSRQLENRLTNDEGAYTTVSDIKRGAYTKKALINLLAYGVELFAVNEEQIRNPAKRKAALSRDIPHVDGQVGLRCIFCRDSGLFGTRGSFTFPTDCKSLWRDAWFLCLRHLDSCRRMPDDVRKRYDEFRDTIPIESRRCQTYWQKEASFLRPIQGLDGICWRNSKHGAK